MWHRGQGVLTVEHEVQGSFPALGKTFFALVIMDTKEIEDIMSHRPITHGYSLPFLSMQVYRAIVL